MWLMTVATWTAKVDWQKGSKEAEVLDNKTQCFLTRGRLDDGLRLLEDFSEALRARYGPSAKKGIGTVTEYRLLSVSRIPTDTDVDTLFELGVEEVTEETIAAVDE